MRTLIWKIRFALKFQHLTKTSFAFGWESAGAWIGSYGLDECDPITAVDEELEAWRQSQ